ncbi:glycoside hydrolase [Schizophyllum commune H4-8]|uniref:glycoside hydrolase n=1 Tax=Schizophyllum commune (strain H4-8 / FGSC 9210) TaxID=578458 RepID=UPI00215EE741|nr:glycoside hydrolase [Schizophyllum commune H4-8]KAI5892413.1 glycoside hydrolase [Schizophyllum commune H4-8]
MALSDEVKREIGQHFILGFHGQEVSEDIRTLIRNYHLGHIILMKRNIKDAAQTKRLINELQQIAKDAGHAKPLLIGTDQENGLVSAFSLPNGNAGTQFPGAMALAATGSPKLAYKTSQAIAQELKYVGIQWAFGPVADVNSDPRNPVIGVRSFGDDPATVSKYVRAMTDAYEAAGVAASAKHFPGHGDTNVDSHLGLPRIEKTLDDLRSLELVPFQAAIADKGTASIMTGHMALPKIIGDDSPSSLSRKITTDLLREEMGYQGVVVTDCLEMDAVAKMLYDRNAAAQMEADKHDGRGVEVGSVRALQAGADVVMICHTFSWQKGAIEAMHKAVEDGSLSLDALRESGKRVAAMKERFVGSWDDLRAHEAFVDSEWATMKEAHKALSAEAYARIVAVIKDNNVLPLESDGKIVLFTPELDSLNKAVDDAEGVLRGPNGAVRNTVGASFASMRNFIADRAKEVSHIICEKPKEGESQPKPASSEGASAVIFALRNADRAEWQLEYLRPVIQDAQARGVPVVLLSSCAPYDLMGAQDVLEAAGAYLASFEYTREALEAAVRVIFGEITATAKVPVKVDYA